jgi:hypothetical protein
MVVKTTPAACPVDQAFQVLAALGLHRFLPQQVVFVLLKRDAGP